LLAQDEILKEKSLMARQAASEGGDEQTGEFDHTERIADLVFSGSVSSFALPRPASRPA
jgi:hypothetical protein